MLTDTSFRDKTQVVSRWFRRLNRGPNRALFEDVMPHNILMVDQLWLWIFRRPGYPDTLITSFPDRKGATPTAGDDLQRQILDDKDRDSRNHTGDLVAQILAVCCRTLSPNQDVESVNFLQCFEESIAHLVSLLEPSHMLWLNNFQIQEEKASQLFQEFRLLSIVLQGLDDSHPRYQKRRRVLLGELLDISRESQPLTEVKDILDEIKIIQTTLEDQVTIIHSDKMVELENDLATVGLFNKARNMITRASRNFEVLKSRAEAVEKSVSLRAFQPQQPTKLEQIEHLLDLKQKQANLWEARTSREGADENAQQGNVRDFRPSKVPGLFLTFLSQDSSRFYCCYYYFCKSQCPIAVLLLQPSDSH